MCYSSSSKYKKYKYFQAVSKALYFFYKNKDVLPLGRAINTYVVASADAREVIKWIPEKLIKID